MDRDNDQVNTQLEEENRYLKSLVIKGEEFADEMYEELLKCYDCFVKVENEIDDEECLGAIFDILEHQTAIEDKLMDLTVLRNEIKHEQDEPMESESVGGEQGSGDTPVQAQRPQSGASRGEDLNAPSGSGLVARPMDRQQCTFDGCTRTFRTTTHMKIHMNSHNPKDFKCKFNCPGVFRTEGKLSGHMRKEHPNTCTFICHRKCNRGFFVSAKYNEHLQWHDKIDQSSTRVGRAYGSPSTKVSQASPRMGRGNGSPAAKNNQGSPRVGRGSGSPSVRRFP